MSGINTEGTMEKEAESCLKDDPGFMGAPQGGKMASAQLGVS